MEYEGYDPYEYSKQYYEAEGDTTEEKLNSMRRMQYAKDKDEINAKKREAYAEKIKFANSDDSSIINPRGNEMLQNKDGGEVDAMPEDQFQRIVEGFKRQGGEIRTDEEAQRYLDFREADGVTIDEKLVFLRKNPSRSAVFEELIHTSQFRNGDIVDIPRDVIKCEIEAKTKLIKYAKWYNLTETEIENTKRSLQKYKEELKKLDGV